MTIGKGARLCVQLFRFVSGMIDIAAKQQPFIDFFPATFPDWLSKLFELQRVVRQCEKEILFSSVCMTALLDTVQNSNNDQWLTAILENESISLRNNIEKQTKIMKIALKEEENLRNSELKLETDALISMNKKIIVMKDEIKLISHSYRDLQKQKSQGPAGGDNCVVKLMSDTRHKLLVQNILLEQFTNQIRVATLSAEVNRNHRKGLYRLPPDVRLTTRNAAESKALHSIAVAKKVVMMRSVAFLVVSLTSGGNLYKPFL